MVGSGAWACAAMHMVAQNCKADDPADLFADEVRMWVYEEDYQVWGLGVGSGGLGYGCPAGRGGPGQRGAGGEASGRRAGGRLGAWGD
jgi:hypothetical protein